MLHISICTRPILKSKGMCAVRFFRKKGEKRARKCFKKAKKGKIFENLGKNVQKLENILKKGR